MRGCGLLRVFTEIAAAWSLADCPGNSKLKKRGEVRHCMQGGIRKVGRTGKETIARYRAEFRWELLSRRLSGSPFGREENSPPVRLRHPSDGK